jgi:hypothetical protein
MSPKVTKEDAKLEASPTVVEVEKGLKPAPVEISDNAEKKSQRDEAEAVKLKITNFDKNMALTTATKGKGNFTINDEGKVVVENDKKKQRPIAELMQESREQHAKNMRSIMSQESKDAELALRLKLAQKEKLTGSEDTQQRKIMDQKVKFRRIREEQGRAIRFSNLGTS